MSDWTKEQSDAAFAEGWGIFEAYTEGGEEMRLERCDEAEIFKDDADVWRYVFEKARGGSELHQAALNYLLVESPAEYHDIIKWNEVREGRL